MDIFSINKLLLFIIFFVPGFVSIKIYDLLIASDSRDFSKSMIEAIAFSAINLALLSWVIWPILYHHIYESHPIIFAILSLFILFVFPGLWPILYVKLISRPWLAKFIVHPIKRPWDWFFNKGESFWTLITLKDGRKIGGVYSNKSYVSSFPLPEQIYLEEVWKLDENGHFLEPNEGSKGVIILNDEISTVEFFKGKEQ